MKQKYTVFTLSLASLVFNLSFIQPIQAEPNNLSLLKKEVIEYHDSGLYEQELSNKIEQARQFIQQQALANQKKDHPKKLALVLDIDETSLSNYNQMAKRDFKDNKKQIKQEMLAANAPAIQPTLALYKEAIHQGIRVFFVTGRGEYTRKATETNLTKAGYKNWSGLYLRPNQYNASSIIPFKSKARALISKQGYTIVASIGDQLSDINGGYVLKGFKLPNPYYYLP